MRLGALLALMLAFPVGNSFAAPIKEGMIIYSGGAGDWGRVYSELKDSIQSFDPVTKQVFIVVGYLYEQSEDSWRLRRTLTQSDFDLANAWIDQHDDTTNTAGMFALFAGLKELQGDYEAGLAWAEKARKVELVTREAHCGAFTYLFVCDYKRKMDILLGNGSTSGQDLPDSLSKYEAIRDLISLSARAQILPLLDTLVTDVRKYLIQSCGWKSYTSWYYSELAALTGDNEEALKAMSYAATDGDCVMYRQRLLDMLIERGEYADALARCQGYVKDLKDETSFLVQSSGCHAGLGDYGKAISGFTKHLKANPGDRAALLGRGHAYLGKNDLKKATVDADAAIAANGEDGNAWYLKGMIAKAESDPKSQEYLEKSVSLLPEGSKARLNAEAALK